MASEPERPDDQSTESTSGNVPDPAVGRLLVIAAAAIEGQELRDEVVRHLDGSNARVHVVAPALARDQFHHAMGDVDAPREDATERMDRSIETLRAEGIEVSGDIGDADPKLALADSVGDFDPQEILILTHASEDGLWLENEIFDDARREYDMPVIHVVVGDSGEGIAERERSGVGADEHPEPETEGESANLPTFSVRDIFGIIVALLGIIVLVVIVAGCEGASLTDLNNCSVAILIAGFTALINLAHVVALMLFDSVGYRGGWQRAFGNLSLVLTPAAIVATLLLV
ncbi:hypothetical protein HJD18_04185 [Thermoleophilia bacterium SCSIO 60948]|nr:hypothetical protein HJD18_04185 [Thermoleophilia bacterium SCSIO 60948]